MPDASTSLGAQWIGWVDAALPTAYNPDLELGACGEYHDEAVVGREDARAVETLHDAAGELGVERVLATL